MQNKQYPSRKKIDVIAGAWIIFQGWDPQQQYDIILDDRKIKEIVDHKPNAGTYPLDAVLDARNCLIAPSLCHAHVHLDKCFLLSDPKYADLEIIEGDFTEAMELTSKAKARFEKNDLVRRGQWLISESIAAGVTHMRAFAEVDQGVEFKCLDAAIELKKSFNGACEIQICTFAQEPIFVGPHENANRTLMSGAMAHKDVDVIGSTPYVEDNDSNIRNNFVWAIEMGLHHSKHVDLHMDYHLDPKRKPIAPDAVQVAKDLEKTQARKTGKTMVFGHCTRLTQNSPKEWHDLSSSIRDNDLPVSFVGLPTSDLFMMGKPDGSDGGGQRVRGTLQIPQMIKEYRLNGAISINNVGNAFTPQGSCDPLTIASMGVGLYHAGTKQDAQLLYECVSTRAKAAIGYPTNPFAVGSDADFVLFERNGDEQGPISRQMGRRTLQEVVYDPPKERKTIFRGHLIIA